MSDILIMLFNGTYDPTPNVNDEQRELLSQLNSLSQPVQDLLGLEFVDRFNAVHAELEEYSGQHYFREGFRLGARMMLEALGPA